MHVSHDGPDRIGHQSGRTPLNNLISYLDRHRAAFPERIALRWVERDDLNRWDGDIRQPLPHRQLSYAALTDGIERVAARLHDHGLHPGDRAIIFLPMGPMMYLAMFAVQRLGAIAVFLDSWARRDQLAAGVACVGPKAMISHPAAFTLAAAMPEFEQIAIRIVAGKDDSTNYTDSMETMLDHEGRMPVAAVEAETTALVTFTTGSSGVPKGANRTHRFLCAQHETLASLLPYAPETVDLPAFPIFSLNNLACGITTVVPALDLAIPGPGDAALLVTQIRHEQIPCATLSPSMLNGVARFCKQQAITLDGLRRVVTGGAPISRDNARDFLAIAPHAECWILYGSTEVEPMAHVEAQDLLRMPQPPDPEWVEEGVYVGHLCADLDAKLIRIRRGPIDLAETPWPDLEVASGDVGELVVTGDHVCRDYYNNPAAFRQTKIEDADGRVWHRTGDLARIDENGGLWIVGRVHNAIERDGRYLFPVRSEILLNRLPFVTQAAFLGMPDQRTGERTVAAVVLDRQHADEAQATAEIHRVFAKNDIPLDHLVFIERIPMDPRHHSKVEYGQLRQILETDSSPC